MKDTFVVMESKLDPSFLDSQFSIIGYHIVRKVRNKNGGGILSTYLKTYLKVIEILQKQTTTRKFRNPDVRDNFR